MSQDRSHAIDVDSALRSISDDVLIHLSMKSKLYLETDVCPFELRTTHYTRYTLETSNN
jgi:hypothetical protein